MFEHLCAPLTVRTLILPNRLVMGSMHLGFEDAPDGFERLAAFYAERARGGVGLIVTGGVAPNPEGAFGRNGPVLADQTAVPRHRLVTDAIHAAGGRVLLQILHTGRYGKHERIVAPSPIKSAINSFTPREMSDADIERTIEDYVRTALLAQAAGYDGVEVMASEGYLLNAFLARRSNRREDRWGGALGSRMRLLCRIVLAIRAAASADFILSVRLTVLELVEDGLTGEEIVAVAQAVEAAGADILNSGVGWHEARVPTIAHSVPPGAWTWAMRRVKEAVSIPVVASNRINTPALAEAIIARGDADLVALARPFLADPAFARKTREGRPETINLCIGCNQGCLDAMFSGEWCSCQVNPRAGRELDLVERPAASAKTIAVVGGGPAGLACAAAAARRGHRVTLFEQAAELGGQFRTAEVIPGKEEYMATPRYFAEELAGLGVAIRLGRRADIGDLTAFDAVVVATGTQPRRLDLPGADHPKVAGYEDVLYGRRQAGRSVVILGSNGIGYNVAAYLLADSLRGESFDDTWGIDRDPTTPGGLKAAAPAPPPVRRVVMMQRTDGRSGAGLGKTTGWIRRGLLLRHGVETLTGVTYRAIDDSGIHVTIGGQDRLFPADTIITCIGQERQGDLYDRLRTRGIAAHVIGGAAEARDLDARVAIEQGVRLGLSL